MDKMVSFGTLAPLAIRLIGTASVAPLGRQRLPWGRKGRPLALAQSSLEIGDLLSQIANTLRGALVTRAGLFEIAEIILMCVPHELLQLLPGQNL